MNKFNKSELVVLFVLALLLGITPLLPSSLTPAYLYFIFNVLIIALGAEAGLLSIFSKPLENKKEHVSAVTQLKPVYEPQEREEAFNITSGSGASEHDHVKKPKVVEKTISGEKIVDVTEVKKCPSMPNLSFIGCGESVGEVMDEEIGAEDEVGVVNNEQELYAKAEAFIGNFYKQLKMQREDSSWLYQEAF